MHVILFMGKDIYACYKSARKGVFNDRHHVHMVEHYKEAPWWWYVIVLVASFFLGLIVVLKGNITLSAWAYVVALIVGCVIAPFVSQTITIPTYQSLTGIEHDHLLQVRQWYRNEQPVEDARRFDGTRAPSRKHVFRSVVTQRHQQYRRLVQRSEDGRVP
jgi:hypothetical protein